MSDTRMKLEEAAFFIQALQNNVMIAPINGFALSAFVSAARRSSFNAPSSPGESIQISVVIGAPHQREVIGTRKTTAGREEPFSTVQTTDLLINEYFEDEKNQPRATSIQGVISDGVAYPAAVATIVMECEERFGQRIQSKKPD